jgi:hypothetical protein
MARAAERAAVPPAACSLDAELPCWASPDVEEGQHDLRLKKALTCGSHTSASPSHLVRGNLVRSHEEIVAAARDMIKYGVSDFFLKEFAVRVLIFEEASNWVPNLERQRN